MSSFRAFTKLPRTAQRPLVVARQFALLQPQLRTKATVPFRLPDPRNEPNPNYERGSPERAKLEETLTRMKSQMPCQSEILFNGTSQKFARAWEQPLPADHKTAFTSYPLATKEQVSAAIESALKVKKTWENTPFVDRAAIFLK